MFDAVLTKIGLSNHVFIKVLQVNQHCKKSISISAKNQGKDEDSLKSKSEISLDILQDITV